MRLTNTFFVVEVVRALAEEAGSLAAVAERTLPQRVIAGGIEAIVERRLGRVPPAAQPLLRLAAVAGRELDLQLLGGLEPRLEACLHACAQASVLEVDAARWRFAHDKLRQGVLSTISEAERAAIHGTLAINLEKLYGDADQHAAALGYHFDRAQNPRRAIFYLGRAGTQALRRGSLHEAADLLERCAALQEQLQAPELDRATTYRRLARAQYGLGRNEECVRSVRSAMRLVGQPIPSTPSERRRMILNEVLIELRHRIFAPTPLSDAHERALKQEQLNIVTGTGDSLFISDSQIDLALYVTLAGLHAAERIGDIRHQITYLSALGFSASMVPAPIVSRLYLRRAKQLARGMTSRGPLASFYFFGGLIALSNCRWDEAEEYSELALQIAHDANQVGQEALAHNILTALMLERDRPDRVTRHAMECLRLGGQLGNEQIAASGHGWLAFLYVRRGDYHTAFEQMRVAVPRMEKTSSLMHKLTLNGAMALCALHVGETKLADEQCELSLRRMEKVLAPASPFLVGYTATLEASLGLLQRAGRFSEKARAHRQCRRALTQLARFALIHRIGRPALLRGIGRLLYLQNLPRLARPILQAARALAQRLDMKFEMTQAERWRKDAESRR